MFSIFALAVDAFTLLAVHCQRTVIIVQVVTDPFVLQLALLALLRQTSGGILPPYHKKIILSLS